MTDHQEAEKVAKKLIADWVAWVGMDSAGKWEIRHMARLAGSVAQAITKAMQEQKEKMLCGHAKANYTQLSESVKGCSTCYEVKAQREKDAKVAEGHQCYSCRYNECNCRPQIAQAIRDAD